MTDGLLEPAMAAARGSLLEARSDMLILREEDDPEHLGPPQVALGLWRSGRIAWHHPLRPWFGADGVMWLVPEVRVARDWRHPAFRLIAKYLRCDLLPWLTDTERAEGFTRAAKAFAGAQT